MDVFVKDAAGKRKEMVVKEHSTLAEVVEEAERVLGYEVKGCTELWYDGAVVAEGGDSSFCGLTGISAGDEVQAVYSNAKMKEEFKTGKVPFDHTSPDVMRGDAEIVLLAAQRDTNLLKYALPSLRGDKGFMLSALKAFRYCYGSDILHHATPELLDDAGFAADAIMTRPLDSLLNFSKRLQTDPRVCLLHKATKQRLLPDPVLSDDTEVAMLQIEMWDRAHEATPWDFSDDHSCCLQHVSERLQGDKELVLAAVEYDGMSLKHAAGPLRNDPDVVRAAVQQNGMALGFASGKEEEEEEETSRSHWKKRVGVLRSLCIRRMVTVPTGTLKPGLVKLLRQYDKEKRQEKKAKEAKEKEEEKAKAKEKGGEKEKAIGEKRELDGPAGDQPPAKKPKTEVVSFRSNPEFAMLAVKQNWMAVCHLTGAARDSKEVALKALRADNDAYDYLPKRLQEDKDVAVAMVSSDGRRVQYLPKKLKQDKCVVLAAVKQNWMAVCYLQFHFFSHRDNKEMALEALRADNDTYDYLPKRLRNDKEVALTMVSSNGMRVQCLPKKLRKDKCVVLAAVKQDGTALKCVKQYFDDDRDVALVACISGGWPYLSDRLKGDKQLAMRAVAHDGKLFEQFSPELRSDKDVALIAVKTMAKLSTSSGHTTLKMVGEGLAPLLEFAYAVLNDSDCTGVDELKMSVLRSTLPEGEQMPTTSDKSEEEGRTLNLKKN